MAAALEVAGEVTTQVIVAVNVETSKRDRYGRQIGKVLVNGRDVNLVQIERGMAWFYRQYQREQSPNDRRLYEAAEDAARADKRAGLGHGKPITTRLPRRSAYRLVNVWWLLKLPPG